MTHRINYRLLMSVLIVGFWIITFPSFLSLLEALITIVYLFEDDQLLMITHVFRNCSKNCVCTNVATNLYRLCINSSIKEYRCKRLFEVIMKYGKKNLCQNATVDPISRHHASIE